jgi:hypothetical protein
MASFTSSFYPPSGEHLIFTQPFETIDKQRVNYYQDIISKGQRPCAIVICGGDANYILDGHHKLIAYKNLNINPPLYFDR